MRWMGTGTRILAAGCAVVVLASGCNESAFTENRETVNPLSGIGVGQGGAQDFGLFKEILEDGGIPGPNTIDDVGFFAEHKIELPPATCGDTICVHAKIGHMGNLINGADCTIVQLGMNAPPDVLDVERPPLNLALVVDTSASMKTDELDAMEHVRIGLLRMLSQVEEGDRISLIDFDTTARVVVSGTDDVGALETAILGLTANGATNISGGMQAGYSELDLYASPEAHSRMILVSDGVPNRGELSAAVMQAMAASRLDGDGYDLTTIGLGSDFDIDLMRGLAEEGGGSFYYLSDVADVEEVFVDEVGSFLVPLAEDVTLDLSVSGGPDLVNVFGTRDFSLTGNELTIDIDRLQAALRTSDEDQDGGRRGGGGAIVAEIMPGPNGLRSGPIGQVDLAYTDVRSGERVEQQVPLVVAPDEVDPLVGWFEGPGVEKSFVMLNIFAGFEFAAELSVQGNFIDAHDSLVGLCFRVEEWLEDNPDADIADDLRYLRMFVQNVAPLAEAQRLREENPPGRDFGWRRD